MTSSVRALGPEPPLGLRFRGLAVLLMTTAVAIGWPGGGRPALAQEPHVLLQGIVVDEVGASVPGVLVQIQWLGSDSILGTAVTDGAGFFHFALPPGRYRVVASLDGLLEAEAEVSVVPGQLNRVTLTLTPVTFQYVAPGDDPSAGHYDRAPEDRPPGVQHKGYFEVFVYYATDRERLGSGDQVRFTANRGSDEELSYGAVLVSIPDDRESGRIQSPRWFHLWGRDDPSRFVRVLGILGYPDQGSFATVIRGLLSEVGRDDVLLFIHGYNSTFEDAARRTAQLAYDLDFTGAPLFYTWPSKGDPDGYLRDEESVKWTRPHFERFLRFTLTRLGARNVHVIAHSMGNRVLAQTLARIDLGDLPEGSARLRQIILAAPDIDVDVFRQLARNFPGKADRVTLYMNAKDKALDFSARGHQNPRAGNTVVVVDGVDTINASAVNTSFLAHSYFGKSLLPDIFNLIWHNRSPDRAYYLERVAGEQGSHWVFQ